MPSALRFDVLQVEDDPDFAEYVAAVLGPEYRLRRAGTAEEARQAVREAEPDLIVLDLILPDGDGLVLCADLRAETDAPILICSATVRRRDAALGLRLGADAFMTKPFDVDEFRARVEALLRRRAVPAERWRPGGDALRVGALSLERDGQHASLAGAGLSVSTVEWRLLAALMRHPGDVLTRQELVHEIWGDVHVSSDRTVDLHIRRLREKLALGPAPAPPIVSVRGFGYKMVAPDGSVAGAA
jgi:DNA-binding response OmpR family regulator